MLNLLPENQNIKFIEESHQYFDKTGKELDSVSSVIAKYKKTFDPDGFIIRSYAKRNNLTVEQVREKWDKERIDACVRGNNLHHHIEIYLKENKVLDDGYKDIVEQFQKIKFSGKLFSEVVLADTKTGICGTSDIISLVNDNTVDILDLKTNKKLLYKSKYRTRLLYPLEEIEECEYWIYSIQLNLYSFILKQNGYKTRKMAILYINPETRILEVHKVPKMDREIKMLIKHYTEIKSW